MARRVFNYAGVGRRPYRPDRSWLKLMVVLGAGAAIYFAAWFIGMSLSPTIFRTAPTQIVAQFSACSGQVRTTCVVDGDTFWLMGAKYRIADIDTPEIFSPKCNAEAALGRRATVRMTELLNQGAFALGATDRDVDRYGRKLRVVQRDGRSLGEILVTEGLARRWDGARRSWCA